MTCSPANSQRVLSVRFRWTAARTGKKDGATAGVDKTAERTFQRPPGCAFAMSSMWLSILAISSALMLMSPSASRSANSAALSPLCLASVTPTQPRRHGTKQLSSRCGETPRLASLHAVRTLSHERGRIPEIVVAVWIGGARVGPLGSLHRGGDFLAAADAGSTRAKN